MRSLAFVTLPTPVFIDLVAAHMPTAPTSRYPQLLPRSHKRGRDGHEVWPEALAFDFIIAFMIALMQLTRMKGRKTAQNKLIADIFFERTGLRRDRGQVASHLQQLRKWHLRDHGRRWDQDLPWEMVVPASPSSSPVSSVGALSSPSAPQASFSSLSPSTSASVLQVPALPPFQPGAVPVLPPLQRFDLWDPPEASQLDLRTDWSLQGSLDTLPRLPGLSPTEPQSASAVAPGNNSLLFSIPGPANGTFF